MANSSALLVILFCIVLSLQHRASVEWETLLFDQPAPVVRAAIFRVAAFWGLGGVALLEIYGVWVVNPGLAEWMFSSGLFVAYLGGCFIWVLWCAWCIAHHVNSRGIWLFNITASAALLTLDYPVLLGLHDGAVRLGPQHLMQFVVYLLVLATIIRMGMTVLGFARMPVSSELNLLGLKFLSPRAVFLVGCAVVDLLILLALWAGWDAANTPVVSSSGAGPVAQMGLAYADSDSAGFSDDSGRTVASGNISALVGPLATGAGSWAQAFSLLLAAGFALTGSAYNRRVYAGLEDLYLWVGSEQEFPRSVRGVLSNTRLIRSTLDMTRIGVVFWKSPEYHKGVGSTDLTRGTTYISRGMIHDEGLRRVHALSNLPDFWRNSIHPEDYPNFEGLQLALSDPSRNHFAHVVRFADGNGGWLYVKGEALVERDAKGLPLAFYGIHTDISQQMSDNRRLSVSNDRRLQAMRTIGHDMQSSLSIMSMSLDLMQRFIERGDHDRLDTLVSRMRTELLGAMELLGETVEMARSEENRLAMRREDIRLRALLRGIVQRQLDRYEVPADKVVINCHECAIVRGVNVFALTSLLNNLVSNAIKYTPDPTGRVTICAFSKSNSAGQQGLGLTIEDEGIGIPAQFQAILFEAFQRGANVQGIEGTGLGMTIVRSSADALAAQLHFTSMPERESGTLIEIWLPNQLDVSATAETVQA